MHTLANSAILALIIRIAVALVSAVVLGNGIVVGFNHMPEKWFADWTSDGDAEKKVLPPKLLEADKAGRQRLTSNPWKWVFTGLFVMSGVYLSISSSIQYEVAALAVMAVVLIMAVSDQLYKIVPDQFQILLVITSIGFITYNENWWEPLAGAGIGLAISLAILGMGLLIFKTGSIGGADIKFYTCMGFVAGRRGIIVIFILTTFIFAAQSAFKIWSRRGTIRDRNAMMPAAFVATTVYLLFLFNITDMIQL